MFAFRLCLQVGCPHPDYLLTRMTSQQIAEWMAYYNLRPFGQDYSDFLLAQFNADYCNVHKKKGSPVVTADDRLPLRKIRPPSPQEIRSVIRQAQEQASGRHRQP